MVLFLHVSGFEFKVLPWHDEFVYHFHVYLEGQILKFIKGVEVSIHKMKNKKWFLFALILHKINKMSQ